MISKGETFLLRGVLRSKIVLTEFESLPVREKSYERALFRFQRIFVTDDFSKKGDQSTRERLSEFMVFFLVIFILSRNLVRNE